MADILMWKGKSYIPLLMAGEGEFTSTLSNEE